MHVKNFFFTFKELFYTLKELLHIIIKSFLYIFTLLYIKELIHSQQFLTHTKVDNSFNYEAKTAKIDRFEYFLVQPNNQTISIIFLQ